MTLKAMVEKMADEMGREAAANEKKGEVIEALGRIMETAASKNKVDGCELFDVCHRLNEEFPDYVSAIVAMSLIGWFGIDAGYVEIGEQFLDLDADDIIGGAEIEGEE